MLTTYSPSRQITDIKIDRVNETTELRYMKDGELVEKEYQDYELIKLLRKKGLIDNYRNMSGDYMVGFEEDRWESLEDFMQWYCPLENLVKQIES